MTCQAAEYLTQTSQAFLRPRTQHQKVTEVQIYM